VFRQAPKYPAPALAYHLYGIVKLNVDVGSDGTVKSTEVVGGNPVLVEAALKAVAHWKWEPAAKTTREMIEVSFEGAQ